MLQKKKLLLCWWYDRRDLFAPFLELTDTFEITLLFYRFKEQEQLSEEIPFKRLYWTEHRSPYDMLNQVQPDVVGFMGVENALTLGLLLACKNRRIPTCYIAHGIKLSYKSMLSEEKDTPPDDKPARYRADNPIYHRNKSHSIKFLMNAIRPGNLQHLPFVLRFLWASRKYAYINERLYNTPSDIRLPDKYLVFSRRFARMLTERDRVPDDRYIEVGPYSMDALFRTLASGHTASSYDEPYFLLIDQPIAHIPQAERSAFYKKLAHTARQAGRQLVIKLHPMHYDSHDLPADENIRFVRQTDDLPGLIKQADGCYGYYSGLLLPIMYFKPSILFLIDNDELTHEWSGIGLVKALPFREFDPAAAGFEDIHVSAETRKIYLERYIIAADGKGVERLRGALLSLISCHVHR